MPPSRHTLSNRPLHTRKSVLKAFKIRGLTIQTSACDAILNILKREDPEQHQSLIHSLAGEIKERSLRNTSNKSSSSYKVNNSIVTKALVTEIVAERTRNENDIISESVQLLDAFQMPRLQYDIMRRQFNLLQDGTDEVRSIHADAIHKVDMLMQRFAMIQQKVLRQECFRPKLIKSSVNLRNNTLIGDEGTTTVLTPVESLLGRTGRHNLLGMIVQVEEGRYYLEDLTGQVPLDLSNAEVLSDSLICENCVVLAEGEMQDEILHVFKIGSPPPESRQEAFKTIGVQKSDIFGAFSSEGEMQKLYDQEVESGADTMFVVLSDIHLDKPHILNKLEQLFDGFSEVSPLPIFVFMGNFTSRPIRASRDGGIRQAVGYFDQLGKTIYKYPKIAKEARFVFIPGPHDPGVAGGMLPHPPIPNFFTSGIKKYVTHAVFASNPCRLRFFTREFVFFREDIVGKLRCNCILRNNVQGEEGEGLDTDENDSNQLKEKSNDERMIDFTIQTILDQAHLCPLPLISAPVFWQYDHALRIYPTPDALILGDSHVDQFQRVCVGGCDVMNPGSFSLDSSFVVYTPVEKDDNMEVRSNTELSQID